MQPDDFLLKLSVAVEQTGDCFLVTDANGVIQYVNRQFELTTGYAKEEAIGRTPRILKSGKHDQKFYEELWKTLLSGRVFRRVFINKRKNGELFHDECTISPVKDEQGRIIGFVSTCRDATDRIKLEGRLLQSQKMEPVGRLAGGIAHDFNNLLTEILGCAALALSDLPPESGPRTEIEEIVKAAERGGRLTRQLLIFSRRQPVEPKVFSLGALLKDMDPMLRRLIGEDIEFLVRAESDGGFVSADPGQIEQVIMNLVVNARDAMPEGGRCAIETANAHLDKEYEAAHPGVPPGEYVLLSVSDTGVGMTEEVKAHLFEPFFTTKEKGKGTGLGLATCYGIVKQAGGHIAVYSEPGAGTTVKVYLPRVPGEEAALRKIEKPIALPRGSETVLLVEDELKLRELAARMLEAQGYTVLAAADATEALRIAEARRAQAVHLLLTDVILPGMGGKELAERLKLFWPGLKVLYTSGYTENVIAHQGILDPGIHFLQKPYTRETLALKVRETLDKA